MYCQSNSNVIKINGNYQHNNIEVRSIRCLPYLQKCPINFDTLPFELNFDRSVAYLPEGGSIAVQVTCRNETVVEQFMCVHGEIDYQNALKWCDSFFYDFLKKSFLYFLLIKRLFIRFTKQCRMGTL